MLVRRGAVQAPRARVQAPDRHPEGPRGGHAQAVLGLRGPALPAPGHPAPGHPAPGHPVRAQEDRAPAVRGAPPGARAGHETVGLGVAHPAAESREMVVHVRRVDPAAAELGAARPATAGRDQAEHAAVRVRRAHDRQVLVRTVSDGIATTGIAGTGIGTGARAHARARPGAVSAIPDRSLRRRGGPTSPIDPRPLRPARQRCGSTRALCRRGHPDGARLGDRGVRSRCTLRSWSTWWGPSGRSGSRVGCRMLRRRTRQSATPRRGPCSRRLWLRCRTWPRPVSSTGSPCTDWVAGVKPSVSSTPSSS